MIQLLFVFVILISGSAALVEILLPDRNITIIEQLTWDLEFSKDISSVLTEAILKSKCDGVVIITSNGCRDHLDYTLQQMSEWAPPVLLVTYQDFKKIGNSELWAKFLAWKKRPCSIVFVCDVMKSEEEIAEDGSPFSASQYLEEDDIGHLKLPKFIDSSDQVLYLSDKVEDYFNGTGSTNSLMNRDDIQAKILKQSGILLQIAVENRTESEPEALMHVYSVCEYCGESAKWQQRDLGYWQRNKTQFGKFFHIFSDFHKLSFNNANLNIGYFNHPPHFSCYMDAGIDEVISTVEEDHGQHDKMMQDMFTICEGVEWEMISQMGKSLDFTTSWINLSNPDSGQGYIAGDEASNISNIMILSFEEEKIDLAVGGISVTPKRIMHLDFSNIFANDPIVFVVGKKKSNFALGIWLAFNPEIWPLILLLIGIISLLFHIIIYQYTLEPPKKSKWKWAMSQFLHSERRKPIHVAMFEALEITLQPLLGQPLSATQITHRPRRLLKLLLIIWWFSSLTISTLYNTSLITSLINPIPPKEPEALQDLLDFGYRFKPAGKQGAFFELIKSVLDKVPESEDQYGPVEVNLGTNEEKKTVSLLKQISDRLVKDGTRSTSHIAYVIEESAVKATKWNKKSIGFPQIKVIRERLFLTTYAWPTQRHAPFKNKIDSALGRLNAAGLVDYWYENYGHRTDKSTRGSEFRLREKLSQITLNLQVLQGAFIFLVFGFGLGTVVLGVEHFTKRYKFRFYTKKQICSVFGTIMNSVKKVYAKHFASEHVDLEARRKKNKMRFKGAVRTVTTFKQKNIPYLK